MLSPYRTTWEYKPSTKEGESRGRVTYATTCIVEWEGDIVTLNSGGWNTATTKRKMNQAARQFDLKFAVFQCKSEWFVDVRTDKGGDVYWAALAIPFKDGMQFNMWTGEVL